jgi:hypothetical protein
MNSDVLSRHLKGCEIGLNDPSCQPPKPARRPRIKKACDRCAKLKSKCDNKKQCNQCTHKSIVCHYTRDDSNSSSHSMESAAEAPIQRNKPINSDNAMEQWQPQDEDFAMSEAYHSLKSLPGQVSHQLASYSDIPTAELPSSLVDANFLSPAINSHNPPAQGMGYLNNGMCYDFESIPLDPDLTNFCETYTDGLLTYWNTIPESPESILSPIGML